MIRNEGIFFPMAWSTKVSVAPSTCPPGTELSAEPFVNQFGTNKVKYTCTLCPPGKYKSVNTPTECSVCEAGKYTDQAGESECHFCDPGYEAFEGISCHACQPGSYKMLDINPKMGMLLRTPISSRPRSNFIFGLPFMQYIYISSQLVFFLAHCLFGKIPTKNGRCQ